MDRYTERDTAKYVLQQTLKIIVSLAPHFSQLGRKVAPRNMGTEIHLWLPDPRATTILSALTIQ
jgi:hypothetical protein